MIKCWESLYKVFIVLNTWEFIYKALIVLNTFILYSSTQELLLLYQLLELCIKPDDPFKF